MSLLCHILIVTSKTGLEQNLVIEDSYTKKSDL